MDLEAVIDTVKRTVTHRCLHLISQFKLECIFSSDDGVVFIVDGRLNDHYIIRVFYPFNGSNSFLVPKTFIVEGAQAA